MNNPGLTKSLNASVDIPKYRVVKFTDDNSVEPATAAGDLSFGVTEGLDVTAGERVDVVLTDVTHVTYGAAVTAGERLTAGADGKAVPVAAAADIVIGVAVKSGAADDIGSVLLT